MFSPARRKHPGNFQMQGIKLKEAADFNESIKKRIMPPG
jgi:hypothetical protein